MMEKVPHKVHHKVRSKCAQSPLTHCVPYVVGRDIVCCVQAKLTLSMETVDPTAGLTPSAEKDA